jgi:hypothetical protein
MSSFSSQPVVIDGKAHLLGRLASIISKQVSRSEVFWGGQLGVLAGAGICTGCQEEHGIWKSRKIVDGLWRGL